ncbi:MAG: LemA family protein [Candidatus Kapabacteria bacterium]|nr:LemA family protein [Ignavibacteriota bacterium]MCW5884666.1 LemA family protein [Candidatus Kapabacteria bacterium]
MSTELLIIIAVAVVLFLIVISMYNGLINKRNQVENIFGSMDAMLKKRYDLIPNLVASVSQYMKHEADVLTKVTELRSRALSPDLTSDEKVAVNNEISKALTGINIAVENYPDLKASQNFVQLQGSLNEVEEQISAARRAFNAAVTDFNNSVEMFPSNIMASIMGLKRKNVFVISEVERQNVDVSGLFNK